MATTDSHSAESDAPHRIDIEAAWDEFTRMKALVDEADADEFLAVMYAWRSESITDALRARDLAYDQGYREGMKAADYMRDLRRPVPPEGGQHD